MDHLKKTYFSPALRARMMVVFLVALGLLASTTSFATTSPDQSISADWGNHAQVTTLPGTSPSELGEISELDPEEDDVEQSGHVSSKASQAGPVFRSRTETPPHDLAGFAKRPGCHNACGARAPPAA